MTQVFTPRIDHWAARVRDSFSRQGFMAHLGAQLVEVSPGRVVIEADHGAQLTQQHGFFGQQTLMYLVGRADQPVRS